MADEEQNENVEETTPGPRPRRPRPPRRREAAAAPRRRPTTAAARREAGRRRRARRSSAGRRAPRSVAKEAGARPTRTPEERQAERDAARARRRRRTRRAARAKSREKAQAARAATPAEPTPPREHGEGRQKERQGIVVSDKADKTITVRIDTARQHRRYHKIVRSSTTLHAHDESNDAHIGDTVVVRESPSAVAPKRWRLVEVVERAR